MSEVDKWKKAKKEFEQLTGKKKPAEKTLGAFRKSSGLEDALKKVDKQHTAMSAKNSKGEMTAKELDAYNKAVAEFKKESDNYIKLLEATLAKEKDADSAYGKALVMLKKQLKAQYAGMQSQSNSYATFLKDMTSQQRIVAMIVPGATSGLKKMAAFVAKVEAQKTLDTKVQAFNSGIQTATRDITQNINNAVKMQKKGDVTWGGRDPSNLAKILTAWANDGRRLPETADEAAVKREISALTQVVKGVKEWVKANS